VEFDIFLWQKGNRGKNVKARPGEAGFFVGCGFGGSVVYYQLEASMDNATQVDHLLSEVKQLKSRDQIMLFHQMERYLNENAEIDDGEVVDLESAFGLWKDSPVTLELIRQRAYGSGQKVTV
jgi:hypothetical protein